VVKQDGVYEQVDGELVDGWCNDIIGTVGDAQAVNVVASCFIPIFDVDVFCVIGGRTRGGQHAAVSYRAYLNK